MTEGEFDLMDELTRLKGKAEYFEPREELRNLLGIATAIPIVLLINLIFIAVYKNQMCIFPGLLINLTFAMLVFMFFFLGGRYISELEEENEYDPDVLYMIDAQKAKNMIRLIFGLSLLLSLGAPAVGFLRHGADIPFFGYLSGLHVIVLIVMLMMSSKAMGNSEAFGIIRE